jgi:hypothetical protein
MKKSILLFFLLLSGSSWSQNILLVDDNDFITDNSDTLVATLQASTYGIFDYYKVADSATNPSAALLSNYDLVIWYASTDGAGLGFWSNGSAGDNDLTDYLLNGGRAWIIGTDLLYAAGYSVVTIFVPGDFAFDYLGLESYDAQSYGDDGGIGVANLILSSGAPNYFANSFGWIFPTAWWVDGVTGRSGAKNIYEMGPDNSYSLYQSVSMLHYMDPSTNVLSSYFDPALISSHTDRKYFLEKSIYYMFNYDLGLTETNHAKVEISPNPCNDYISVEIKNTSNSNYRLISTDGTLVQSGTLNPEKSTLSIADLSAGMYFLTVDGTTKQVVKL